MVSASVLQVIWGELLPRLIAFKWKRGHFPGYPPGAEGLEHWALSTEEFLSMAHRFLADPEGGSSSLPTEVNPSTGRFRCLFPPTPNELTCFEKRIHLLTKALEQPSSPEAMPIRFMASGGFDFVLSDQGLDLFFPERPKNRLDLLRYYQFRPTGRQAIGIPKYLQASESLAFAVSAPTGPAQVWSGEEVSVGSGCTLGQLVADACLQAERIRIDLPRREGSAIRFSMADFLAAARKVRCWQIEGAVYRGILEQLPRVVATIWREQLLSCTANDPECPTDESGCPLDDPQSYAPRWGHRQLMRDIFCERLETSLPGYPGMLFQVGDPAEGDVMVTNQGLFFPDLPPAPSTVEMFLAMSVGAAGNPVFTDCMRPECVG